MGLFGNHAPMQEPELSPALKARLDALEERVRLQEKGLKALELDWQEWFDKFRLMYARLSKRIKEAAAAVGNGDGEAQQSLQDAPQSTIPRAVSYDRPAAIRGGPKGRGNY